MNEISKKLNELMNLSTDLLTEKEKRMMLEEIIHEIFKDTDKSLDPKKAIGAIDFYLDIARKRKESEEAA